MTDQVLVAGQSYSETRITVADIPTSRIEAILLDDEQLLHEVWAQWMGTTKTAYVEDSGILALTPFRVLKYHTGKGERSTMRGEGQLVVHWSLVHNPEYLNLVQTAAAGGHRQAADILRSGVQILSGYESGPVKRGKRDPETVGYRMAKLHQTNIRDSGQGPTGLLDSLPGALGSAMRFNRRWQGALHQYNESVVRTGKWTGFGQSKVQNKDLDLKLIGPTPDLLRIDELLSAAANEMVERP